MLSKYFCFNKTEHFRFTEFRIRNLYLVGSRSEIFSMPNQNADPKFCVQFVRIPILGKFKYILYYVI